jgi:hypothetical protein
MGKLNSYLAESGQIQRRIIEPGIPFELSLLKQLAIPLSQQVGKGLVMPFGRR